VSTAVKSVLSGHVGKPEVDNSPNSKLLRHVTTRHNTLSSQCILVQEKVVRAVSRMLYTASATQHVATVQRDMRDTPVTTSATSPTSSSRQARQARYAT